MHNQKKNQSIQIDKEMTSVRELVDKNIKTILNILHVFKKVEENMNKIQRERKG